MTKIPLRDSTLTVDAAAVDLALAFAERGIDITVSPRGRLTFTPEHRVTVPDRIGIGRHRDDLIAIAIYVEALP